MHTVTVTNRVTGASWIVTFRSVKKATSYAANNTNEFVVCTVVS